jgi:release factor glutamine methyltransferase
LSIFNKDEVKLSQKYHKMNSEKQPEISPVQKERTARMSEVYQRQPYLIELDGIKLNVARGVFPPEQGYTTKLMAKVIKTYSVNTVLDMGCGSGYLALTLRKNGVPNVWAADLNQAAVECTKENIKNNPDLAPIEVVHSNLFSQISPEIKFDLIVFNQPFYYGNGPFNVSPDEGRPLNERFLKEARNYLKSDGKILMNYSDLGDEINNPKGTAELLGYQVKVKLMEQRESFSNEVYEFS